MICRAGKGDLCGIHLQACDHLHIRGLCTNHVKPTKVTNGHQWSPNFKPPHLISLSKRGIYSKSSTPLTYMYRHIPSNLPFRGGCTKLNPEKVWSFAKPPLGPPPSPPRVGIFMKNIKFQCVFWPFLTLFKTPK